MQINIHCMPAYDCIPTTFKDTPKLKVSVYEI